MKSFSNLIDELGGSTALAAELGIPATTVASWKSRDRLPASYWTAILKIAAKQRKRLSKETLADFAMAAEGAA